MPRSEAQKAWAIANKEKTDEYQRAYREKNRDDVLLKQKEYRIKQNKKMTIVEENIITKDGKTYKQIIRRGHDWSSEYLDEIK
jgi:hypothetical protein